MELTPKTRKETFLAAAGGQDVTTPTPITREEVFLDAIAKGGGSSLPPVTSADNGKVLAVNDGAWAADSNLFLVTVTGTASDKSRSEILDAIAKGRSVALIKGTSYYFPSGQDNSYVYFISEVKIANDRYFNVIAVNESKVASADKLYMLPSPATSDNGKELIIKNSSITYQDKKFVVTLTPTALDFSGTMDKTVAEINTAYEAGQEIMFRVMTSATTHMDVDCTARWFSGATYPSFNGFILDGDKNVFLFAFTRATDDGTKQTYSTNVYSLTPAS